MKQLFELKKPVLSFFVLVAMGCTTLHSQRSPAQESGGSDRGGGNTINGRPIESYVIDPTTVLAYKNFIQPVLEKIKSEASAENDSNLRRQALTLQQMLKSTLTQKLWYFVPGPLSHVDNSLLQAAIKTEQGALQSHDRVWVDSNIWSKMASEEDRARLLLHEMVMNLKILQFGKATRQEYAANSDCATCSFVNEGEPAHDQEIKLTAQDYFEVQKITTALISQFSIMKSVDFINLVKKNNFYYTYDFFRDEKNISRDSLREILKSVMLSRYLPTNGFNSRILGPKLSKLSEADKKNKQKILKLLDESREACKIGLVLSGDKLNLTLRSKTENLDWQFPIKEEVKVETISFQVFFGQTPSGKSNRIDVKSLPAKINGENGFIVHTATIEFELSMLEVKRVYMQDYICTDDKCSKGIIGIRGGKSYHCISSSLP